MKRKVNITRADIRAASHMDSGNCPIARALRRLISPMFAAHVMPCGDGVEIHHKDNIEGEPLARVKMPAKADRFAADFDCLSEVNERKGFKDERGELRPLSFWLSIPAEYLAT